MTIGTCYLLSKQCITLWEPTSSNDVGKSAPNPHCQCTLVCDLACRFARVLGNSNPILALYHRECTPWAAYTIGSPPRWRPDVLFVDPNPLNFASRARIAAF